MVHIPIELDGIVTAVYGLDNRRMRRRPGRPRPTAPRSQSTGTNPNNNGYFPAVSWRKHTAFRPATAAVR